MTIAASVPPSEQPGVAVIPDPSGSCVLLAGELDLASRDAVVDALVACVGPTVVADLSEVTFLDASGLSALLLARQVLARRGERLAIRGARGAVRWVFELTGLPALLSDG